MSIKKVSFLFVFLCLYKFNIGQSFQEICSSSVTNGTIVDYHVYNDTLYSTGFFDEICGHSTGYVAKWENNEWKPSAIQLSDPGHSLTEINGKLYIAKYEESIDSNWVYVYENSIMQKLGEGVFLTTAVGFSQLPNIYDIIEYKGEIIACGEFDRVGSSSIQGIMRWDGNNWQGLGSGLGSSIAGTAPVMFPHQMMVYNAELYVVGNFKTAGNQIANGIAKWNGTSWTNMGAGFNNTVYSITVYNNEIIVGGSFTESNGNQVNRIAKWNGTDWVPLDFGFTQPSSSDFIFVHTLKVIYNELYIAGGLKEIVYADSTTETCNGIISYSNGSVNTFNQGIPGYDIEAVAKLDNDELIVGGGVYGNGYSGKTTLTTHLPDTEIKEDLLIYPNPTNGQLFLNTEENYKKYELFNGLGDLLINDKFNSEINLNLKSGIYFLKLFKEDNSYSIHKIILN